MEDRKVDEYVVKRTNAEYRIELQKMFDGVDNNRLLRYFYISSLKKIQQEKAVDYQVLNPDYGELIIEMVYKIQSQSALKYIYTIISSYIKSRGL